MATAIATMLNPLNPSHIMWKCSKHVCALLLATCVHFDAFLVRPLVCAFRNQAGELITNEYFVEFHHATHTRAHTCSMLTAWSESQRGSHQNVQNTVLYRLLVNPGDKWTPILGASIY